MKKVILHIGYPKIGTTTLQESVFKNLHQAKLINYLGRSRNKINRFDGVDAAVQLRYFSLYNTRRIEISIEENEVNIISDEIFLMLDLINKIQYHGKNNWRELVESIWIRIFHQNMREIHQVINSVYMGIPKRCIRL